MAQYFKMLVSHCLPYCTETLARETIKTTTLDVEHISGPKPPSDQKKQTDILKSSPGPTANDQVLQSINAEEGIQSNTQIDNPRN
jgi:hypothetical protein